jgi:signal transduction histidine kinase/ligand-binding sensor domain-containing protein/DNA-binding response OmpR family regulator
MAKFVTYKILLISIFLWSCFWAEEVSAGDYLWRSSHITNEMGLSNSAINSIHRDSRGFMWFGTWDGLNRFDGKNIKTFHPDPFDKHTISNNIIRKMLNDSYGNLWIVTERGVDKYSYDLENFQSWFSEFPELSLREHSLQACVGPDGNIWVNALDIGLYRYSPQANAFSRVEDLLISKSQETKIEDFFVHENRIFILRQDTLITWLYDSNASAQIMVLPGLKEIAEKERHWFTVMEGQPYFAQTFKNGGLQIINLSDFTQLIFHIADPAFRITALESTADHKGLWLGTDDGNLLHFNQNLESLETISSKIPELEGKKVKIWSILETPDEILWIGTDGEGVFRNLMKPKPFFQIQRGERQLNHQIVRAIYEDKNGNLWVGTRGNGVNFFPFKNGSTRYFTTSNGLTNNAILSLKEDQNQNLWIGHDGFGIDLLDMKSGKFYHFPRDLQGGEHLEFGSIYTICVDAFGYVWLGTSGYGVIGLDISRRNGTFRLNNYLHLKSDGKQNALKSNIVYAIVEEKPNVIWLATRGAGIYRMNTLSGELQNYSVVQTGEPKLINDDILSLLMGHDGNLWVGSSGGLTRIKISNFPYFFENFTTHNGLPSNTIHAIQEDSMGNIWLSTNKGLSKFDRTRHSFVNFNSADGLQSNEYTDGAACVGQKTGRFHFGGINGIDWFYPHEIVISQSKPQLIFNAFMINNKPILPGDSTFLLRKSINELEEINLRHFQNFFTIEFTTLNFINPNKTLFQYKLENFNSHWVEAGSQREASFTNVPPGRYTLFVKATNEDGIWSDDIRSLRIIVHPPFWKTWPAYLIFFILASTSLLFVYRYHTLQLRKKQWRALEKMKQEKEQELSQYKMQFFTNLAHEFGTPLTLIFASAASLLNTGKSKAEASSLVKAIYQNSRRMQRLIQELLEFRKIDTGREKMHPVNTELVNALNNITDIFSHFARENELDISFEPDISELWISIDLSKIEKIMLNLLSNAIKYTPAGGSIVVSLFKTDNYITIKVSDTGVGIADEVLPNIFESFYQQIPEHQKKINGFKGIGIGLAYTKGLVDLLNGSISVVSKPGKGTTFTLHFPADPVNEIAKKDFTAYSVYAPSKIFQNITDEIMSGKSDKPAKPDIWTTPKKYRVLIAEDDAELANLLFRLLSEQYDISLASDGQKALEVLKHNRIDIVVSDIIMPKVDGLTLCKTIKSDTLTSHIPVILLTAKSEIESRIEGLEMGADSYIPKPFHPRHLFVRIEKLLKAREQAFESFKKNFGTSGYDLQHDFSSHDKELLEKCLAFVEKNYARENIDADIMASHLALSKAQLYRKVKALTGLTPHGLIKNYRLKQARKMIAEKEYSVSDIIFMTGFNNRTYFYRSYKEAFGETPGEIVKS